MAYDADLVERIRAVVHSRHGVTEKSMFGGLAFLIDGHMAVAASSKGGLMLRIDPDRRDELLTDPAASPMVMGGRQQKGWLRVTATDLDDKAFHRWVDIGVQYAASLPPK